MLKKIYNNEYYYKVLVVITGVLYWVWGAMPYVDRLFDAISLISLIYLAKIVFREKRVFSRFSGICSLGLMLAGIGTIIFNKFELVNVIALLYAAIEVFLLTYSSSHKDKDALQKEFQQLAKIYVYMSMIINLVSLAIYFMGIEIIYFYPAVTETTLHLGRSDTSALTGIMANANIMSSFCVIALGLLLYLISVKKRKIYYLLVVIDLVTLYFTYSRGGYVGAFLLIGIHICLNMMHDIKYRPQTAVKYFVLLMFLCIGLLYQGVREEIIEDGVLLITNRSSEEMENSTNVRFGLWKAGMDVALDNPQNFFLGVGSQIRGEVSKKADTEIEEGLYNNMHNVYMQTLVSNGFIGLVLLILLVLGFLCPPTMKLLKDKERKEIIPIFALICALLIINLVESDIFMKKAFEGSMLWIVIGYYYNIGNYKSRKLV